MTDVTVVSATPTRRAKQRKANLPSIVIGGAVWDPRKKFATDIGVSEKTIIRKNYRTAYIGGVAYIPREESLSEIASEAHRRQEAPVAAVPSVRRRRQYRRRSSGSRWTWH